MFLGDHGVGPLVKVNLSGCPSTAPCFRDMVVSSSCPILQEIKINIFIT
ncbi:unnamed protein product [Chondrus crispus]|uniref:Uncharacterized protein n=1 Tax=Chondrus crispus TaxID=2769 RepID=R7QJ07_CHOCR|nr:unnamed protein product [Chondrus crispus]CDF38059.1 unnamed protein product [Chondrus crispus]|eukprot:XP_005717928.1 unnamed protein product [Chondrus crispus]